MTLAIVGQSTKLVENPGKGRRAREEKGASIIEDNKLVSEDFLLHTIHKPVIAGSFRVLWMN